MRTHGIPLLLHDKGNLPEQGRVVSQMIQFKNIEVTEAQKAFDDFASANPTNYLALTAQLGAARCIAQAGDKTKALARIDSIKAANKSDEVATARIEAVEDVIKRFEAKAEAAPAPEVKAEPKQVTKAVPEAKPAEVKPESKK